MRYCIYLSSVTLNASYLICNKSYAEKISPQVIDSDWLPNQHVNSPCTGYYKIKSIPASDKTEISADSSSLARNGESILTGNVIYLDTKQQLFADKAIAYRDDNLKKITHVQASGNIEFLTPTFRALTNQASINLLDNILSLNSKIYYRYYPRNARGEAASAILTKDTSYLILDANYTTCAPNNSDWYLTANEININPKKQVGTAKHAFLYFYDVPIFYSPYLSFPTSKARKSGFLLPVFNSSDMYGYSYGQPYYFNLAPNYDITITPRYMSQRGGQVLFETRHLNDYGKNTINFDYVTHDNKFALFRKETLLSPPPGLSLDSPSLINLKHAKPERFSIKIRDNREVNEHFVSDIDYNYLSDNQYHNDLPASEVKASSDHLIQQAKANFNYNNWTAEGLIKNFQTLHTVAGPNLIEPYRIMPGFSISNNNINLYRHNYFNLIGAVESHVYRFASPRNPAIDKTSEGQRYYLKPQISAQFKKTYGYITPKVAINIRHYDLNQINTDEKVLNYRKNFSYAIPIFSLDSGLYFDKKFTLDNTAYNQTLEPRLFYLNVPNKSQNEAPDFDIKTNTIDYGQLFRDNTFAGFDRQSSANQLTAGIISRTQNFSNGYEYFKFLFGQSFYFQNKSTTICNQDLDPSCINIEIPDYKNRLSPFISQANFNILPKWYGQTEWQWNYLLKKTHKINVGIHYIDQQTKKGSPQTIFNLEYNFLKEGNIQKNINGERIFKPNNRHNNLSEAELSFKIPVHNNVNIINFYSYDLLNKTTLDGYFGAELQKCCWAFRVGYRTLLRLRTNSLAKKKYDNVFTIQFSLKGLGELNSNFENILKNNINNYKNNLDLIY